MKKLTTLITLSLTLVMAQGASAMEGQMLEVISLEGELLMIEPKYLF